MQKMLLKNKIWIVTSFISLVIVAISFAIEDKLAIKVSVYLGLAFLVFTLVPPSIHKILPEKLKTWNSKIIKYRRDVGVVSGILLVLHGMLATKIYGNFEISFSLSYPIITGFLAYWIFIVLLLTSSDFAVRKLKKNWKRLHYLVWLAVGLSFSHAILAKYLFDEKEYPTLAAILIGLIAIASIVQLFRKKFIQFGLLIGGMVLAGGIITSINPNAFNNLNYNNNTNSSSSSSSTATYSSTQTTTNPYNSSTSTSNTETKSIASSKIITSEEFKTRNKRTDCWISFGDKVYDATNYLKEHPGGEQSIIKFCGQSIDAESMSHPGGNFDSKKIQDIVKNYFVGTLQK